MPRRSMRTIGLKPGQNRMERYMQVLPGQDCTADSEVSSSDRMAAAGLVRALRRGNPDALTALLALGEGRPTDELFRLLEARGDDGRPGLAHALEHGHTAVVQAYLSAIEALPFGREQKIHLLEARDAKGVPALERALTKPSAAAAIAAYGEGIASVFPREDQLADRVRLFGAKSKDGVPVLARVLQNGRPGPLKVYAALIRQLPDEHQVPLLEAKRADGTPVLAHALASGHEEVVSAYVTAVAPFLSGDQLRLLEARDRNGIPGFAHALQVGHTAAVGAFVDGIGHLVLPLPHEINLLEARDGEGLPALARAMRSGQGQVLPAYGKVIQRFNLDVQVTILEGKDGNGVPALAYAVEYGYPDMVEAYAGLIRHLPPSTRIRLLRALDGNGTTCAARADARGLSKPVQGRWLHLLRHSQPEASAPWALDLATEFRHQAKRAWVECLKRAHLDARAGMERGSACTEPQSARTGDKRRHDASFPEEAGWPKRARPDAAIQGSARPPESFSDPAASGRTSQTGKAPVTAAAIAALQAALDRSRGITRHPSNDVAAVQSRAPDPPCRSWAPKTRDDRSRTNRGR